MDGIQPLPPDEPPACLIATINSDTTVTRVRLSGELDLSTAAQLGPVVDQALGTDPEVVLMDLSDLTFCDASGLAGLLAAHRRLAAADRRLALTGARPPLRRILEITHLGRLLQSE